MITHEPPHPTATLRTATTSRRVNGLFAAVVVALLIHSDCSGFVEGAE